MDTIHIVVAANDSYSKPLAVMLTSLFENKASDNPVIIYVMDGDISRESKRKLEHSVHRFKLVEMKFVKVNSSTFRNMKLHYHLTKETYYRIAIPDLLSKEIDKVLYLDCDMIVKEDITQLWNKNIENHFLGAVNIPGQKTRFKDLSIPEAHGYFNAGMLLINLKKWREGRISKKVFEYIQNNAEKLRFMDQDALNAILHDKWLKLAPRWNYQVHRGHLVKVDAPAIIHYTTGRKPWNGNPPYRDEYFYYLEKTTWQ